MTKCVPYHHPNNDSLSIDYVADERDKAERRLNADDTGIQCIEQYDLDQTVYIVYEGEEAPDVSADREFDIQKQVSGMAGPDQIITTRILKLFQSIAEEKYEQEDERLAAYKQIEIDKIPEALQRVSWTDSVTVAGGELLSGLILRHALPNANHRTSIAMMSLYFQAISPSFEMPTTTTDEYDWAGWVNEYIIRSKRLLTVRRNVPRFKYLSQAGCTTVERKGGLQISLKEYDLSLSHREALKKYANEHNQTSIEFARNVLKRAGTPELRNGEPISKREFAERLQTME